MTDKVAIVGAGLVGRAWAITFARGGHDVMLFDADDKAVASALSTVESMLRTLELRGMLKGQAAADVRSRISRMGSGARIVRPQRRRRSRSRAQLG